MIVCDLKSINAHVCWVVLLVNSLRVVNISNHQHTLIIFFLQIISVTGTISYICSLIFHICSFCTSYSTLHSHSHVIQICSSLCRGFRVIRVVYVLHLQCGHWLICKSLHKITANSDYLWPCWTPCNLHGDWIKIFRIKAFLWFFTRSVWPLLINLSDVVKWMILNSPDSIRDYSHLILFTLTF